jgi:hypothetical protein
MPEFPLPQDKWNLPCARNMVRNSICRMFMHGYWWINDPDCMLLRKSLSFTDDEIIGIATVKAFSGGSFIISDDLDVVPTIRFKLTLQLLPPTNISCIPLDLLLREMPEILKLELSSNNKTRKYNSTGIPDSSDLMEDWVLFALCNWENNKSKKRYHNLYLSEIFSKTYLKNLFQNLEPINKTISQEKRKSFVLFFFNFWNESFHQKIVSADCDESSNIKFEGISIHSALIYHIGIFSNPKLPRYIGSNLHFSCGLEISQMNFVNTPLMSYQNLFAAFGNVRNTSTIGVLYRIPISFIFLIQKIY